MIWFLFFWVRSLSSFQAPTREMAPKLGCHSPQTCSATRHTQRACWRQPGRSPTMPFGPAEAILAPALMFRVPRFMGRAIPSCWRTVRRVPLHGFAALTCCGKVPDPAQCTVGSKPYLDGTSPSPYVGTEFCKCPVFQNIMIFQNFPGSPRFFQMSCFSLTKGAKRNKDPLYRF